MGLPVLSYAAKRRLTWISVLAGMAFLWWGTLAWGPELAHRGEGAPPAMFGFQARGLIKGALGYPRVAEGLLPVPAPGSGSAAQLALMGWWDGHTWTPKALKRGRLAGKALQVRLGRLELCDGVEVTPARDYNGPQMCQADYRVRWEVPEFERDILQAAPLVGLHYPKGLRTPGEELLQQVTLERASLGWKVQDATALNTAGSGRGATAWTWLSWFL